MLNKRSMICTGVVLYFLVAHPIYAQNDDWKDTLKAKLKEVYTITQTQSDLSGITKPGTVLVVQREGIRGDLVTDESTSSTKVKDGQVRQPGGRFGFFEKFGSAIGNNRKHASLYFKLGERVYVRQIDVEDKEIRFLVFTCEPQQVIIEGTTHNTRFKALVWFEFPKNYLAGADFSNVKAVVESVLADEKGIRSATPKSVELGQTPEQVEEILGRPEKIVKLGPKTIFVYKDLKIIFLNGKVADVE